MTPLSRKFGLILAIFTAISQSSLSFAKEDEFGIEHPSKYDDSNGIDRAKGGEYPGAITSVDAMQLGEVTGESLSHSANYCLKMGQYDKAIRLSKLAIEKRYDDNETHQVYAEALEKKYNKQVEKDPALFNKCLREWLIVLRQEVGDEKGMTWKGIGIPVLGKFYSDEDRVMPARSHIMSLTGYLPKVWETDDRFIKRVGKPVETDVSGKVVAADGKAVKNVQTASKQNDKKQISVRNGAISDSKTASAGNEE
jgi:tetratricopeptide (TPR) repeat protein